MFKRILLETVLIAALGLALALAANQLSPRGLALTKNYFPGATKPSARTAPGTNITATRHGTNAASVSDLEALAARLKEKGLQPLDGPAVQELFRDPRYEQELVVFVDARDDRHYQEGHIPGAYQFDHYHPQNHLPMVLPACQNAQKIVVYCNGGNCEDSEFAALTLKDAGVPLERLLVYAGGMAEWAAHGLPLEIGSRKSGNVRTGKP